jgi:hypothetical protein
MKVREILEEDITPQEMYTVERFANDLFQKYGIDIRFSNHFMNRANDPRNQPPIYIDDLVDMFRKAYKKHGDKIADLPDESQLVIRDMVEKLNLPFVISRRYGPRALVAKTVQRKKNFGTSNQVLPV